MYRDGQTMGSWTNNFLIIFGKLIIKGLAEFLCAQTHYMKTQIDGETYHAVIFPFIKYFKCHLGNNP